MDLLEASRAISSSSCLAGPIQKLRQMKDYLSIQCGSLVSVHGYFAFGHTSYLVEGLPPQSLPLSLLPCGGQAFPESCVRQKIIPEPNVVL
jgi:hypothetical protein